MEGGMVMTGTRHSSPMQPAQMRQAEYIASLASELSGLARDNRLDLLAQILELAATHAGDLVAETPPNDAKKHAA
jgi:hypothetical protein